MDEKPTCPTCGRSDRQHRSGWNKDRDERRYRCMYCQKKYTPKRLAPDWYYQNRIDEVLGMRSRGKKSADIAEEIGVTRQTIHNWLRKAKAEGRK